MRAGQRAKAGLRRTSKLLLFAASHSPCLVRLCSAAFGLEQRSQSSRATTGNDGDLCLCSRLGRVALAVPGDWNRQPAGSGCGGSHNLEEQQQCVSPRLQGRRHHPAPLRHSRRLRRRRGQRRGLCQHSGRVSGHGACSHHQVVPLPRPLGRPGLLSHAQRHRPSRAEKRSRLWPRRGQRWRLCAPRSLLPRRLSASLRRHERRSARSPPPRLRVPSPRARPVPAPPTRPRAPGCSQRRRVCLAAGLARPAAAGPGPGRLRRRGAGGAVLARAGESRAVSVCVCAGCVCVCVLAVCVFVCWL